TRLPPLLAAAYGAFLLLLLAVPANLGSPIGALSFAMFYNRIGWFALALLLVMYLPRKYHGKWGDAADASAAALLLIVQLYIKVTYGVVGICFMLFLLLDRAQRIWVLLSLLGTAFAVSLMEIVWSGSFQHLSDLRDAAKVSGGRSIWDVVHAALRNLADLAVFVLAACCSLWVTRSLRDLAFLAFCAAVGLLIISQNAHGWGIIALYAGIAVAAGQAANTLKLRGTDSTASGARLAAGLPLLFLFAAAPPTAHHAATLVYHAALATTGAGTPVGLPFLGELRTLKPEGGGAPFIARYLESIESGGDLLQSLPERPERVLVLDFANPFSAGLNLRPPRGDSAWLHWGRNVNEATHLEPDEMLGDVEIVMIPKIGINSLPLQQVYGPYITRNFVRLKETNEWTVYQRRPAMVSE
ncbi:MAG TPA: hypothetical protein VHG11_04570, partial [Pseudorhizobium sp.]|nr:hypothetical protein [Pseudorhizobium sp.]